jgi:hypothetical protein
MKITRERFKTIISEEMEMFYEQDPVMSKKGPTQYLRKLLYRYLGASRKINWLQNSTWLEMFRDPKSTADEYALAYSEVMMSCLAHWQIDIPEQWLGCRMNEELPACRKLARYDAKGGYDKARKLAMAAANLEPAGAKKFLRKNLRQIEADLKYYVPFSKSAGDFAETPHGQKMDFASVGGLGEEDDL